MAEATLIDGKAIGLEIRQEVARGVEALKAGGHSAPGLAVILVGENPASQAYVRMKTKACGEAGFHSVQVNKPETISEEELLVEVGKMNADPAIHGILVQLPLPGHISERKVIEAISPEKDVDGFHPISAGNLAIGTPTFVACTPLGIQEMLVRGGVQIEGQFVVVLGRSNIVGRPMAQLLSLKMPGGNATVCVCHSRSRNLKEICALADILIVAIGRAHFVTADMVKPGAVVIDVGMNRVDDAEAKRGYRLVGDVDFEAVKRKASKITPVPGGVGPLTIAMLLSNTLKSARLHAGLGAEAP